MNYSYGHGPGLKGSRGTWIQSIQFEFLFAFTIDLDTRISNSGLNLSAVLFVYKVFWISAKLEKDDPDSSLRMRRFVCRIARYTHIKSRTSSRLSGFGWVRSRWSLDWAGWLMGVFGSVQPTRQVLQKQPRRVEARHGMACKRTACDCSCMSLLGESVWGILCWCWA